MTEPRPARILVADDESTIVDLLRTVLSIWSFEVEVCGDGATALARANEGQFALLLIDYQMPRMTGLEVLRRLRAGNSGTPVVLMSGHLSEPVMKETKKLPGVQLLPKPFTLAALREALDRAVDSGARG
jgi:two-component system OmpR family response regulator